MPTCLPSDLIPALEGTMNRVTLSGDRVHTNTGRRESVTARFSVEDLLRFLDAAAVQVAALVRGRFITPCVTTRSPAGGLWPSDPYLRIDGSAVTAGGERAWRRTLSSDRAYHDAAHPIYVYDGPDLEVRAAGVTNPLNATARFIEPPLPEQITEPGVIDGDQLTVPISGEEFVETIAHIDIGAGQVFTARLLSESSGTWTVDVDRIMTPNVNVTFTRHGVTRIPTRFEQALVEFAAALAFTSMQAFKETQRAIEAFDNEIAPYRLPMFTQDQLAEAAR